MPQTSQSEPFISFCFVFVLNLQITLWKETVICFLACGEVCLQSKMEYLEIGSLVWLVLFGLNCVKTFSTIFTHVDHVKVLVFTSK